MDFEVSRDDLRTFRWSDPERAPAGGGEVVLRVSFFALTANNVTYAVFGDAMSYWQFFPAPDGWGRVPVWGFADVEGSSIDGVAQGERVYGYFPMSTHLVVKPGRLGAASFVDESAHRASLPSVYNQYLRAGAAGIDPSREREYALLRPLFATAFLLDDWLDDDDFFGARSVILASASSKTALGLAALLAARDDVEVVGLTSTGNVDFVDSVGYYDRAVDYRDIASLDADAPSVFVDMAGDGRVLADVHRHLGSSLQQSCLVGKTHWDEAGAPSDLPGPAPTFFFAPDRVTKRSRDWGPGGLESRLSGAWQQFLGSVDGWLTIVERRGREEAAATWLEVLEGRADPATGFILSIAD